MAIGDGNLVPDRIPDWLQNAVKKSRTHNLESFAGLRDYFKEEQVVVNDRFDRSAYKQMRNKADELDKLAKSRHVDKPSWEQIVQDEFLGLYKAEPQIRPDKDMKPTHLINHAALSRAAGTREWDELLTYTQLDEWSSAMAAVDFGLKLQELFDEEEELSRLQQQIDEQNQAVAAALDAVKDASGDELEQALNALQEATEGFSEAAGNVTKGIAENGTALRRAAREAAKATKEEVEGTDALIESFGTEPGALSRMDSTARMALANRIRNNRNLKELASKVGRFVRLAMSEQAQKIVHGIDEVHDIEVGNDIHKVLPSELMLLGDEDLEVLFLNRYANKELLQYQLRGTEKVSRGAIICMIDSSGSMQGVRDTWARAVAIALLHIAAKQKRDFYGILFSSYGDPLMEFHFPLGMATPDQVLDMAELSLHGGTDFEKPINRAVDVLAGQFNEEGSQKGDLVMITDGECAVSEDWLTGYMADKDRLAFRMYSCLIGTDSSTLSTLSDEMYHVTDFNQGGDVKDMFGYV